MNEQRVRALMRYWRRKARLKAELFGEGNPASETITRCVRELRLAIRVPRAAKSLSYDANQSL